MQFPFFTVFLKDSELKFRDLFCHLKTCIDIFIFIPPFPDFHKCTNKNVYFEKNLDILCILILHYILVIYLFAVQKKLTELV